METLQTMRAEQLLGEETIVVALTANAIVGARESYIKAGFADYLTKPIEIPALEKTLELYLPEKILSTRRDSDKTKAEVPWKGNIAQETEITGDVFTMPEMRAFHEKCPMIDLLKRNQEQNI